MNTNYDSLCPFLCDLLIVGVVTLSGIGCLTNVDEIGTSRETLLALIPESLHLLCERDYWKDHETKVS